MFGYIVANIEDLSVEEKVRYREVYCGLCRTIGEQCGQPSRAALAYDMAFLILLYQSLYEPSEQSGEERCAAHPLKPHTFSINSYTGYAADLTVALAYHKCLDNWADDRSVPSRAGAAALEKPYRAIRERLPRQCAAIERELAAIGELEKTVGAPPDAAANHFGALMGELFVYEQDRWADELRRLGAHLGRFIYLMDAACDFDQDRKSNSYNPLVSMGIEPRDAEVALSVMIGEACEAFEKLPLEQDLHLMRSVLYAGVWQKYNVQYKKEDKDARLLESDAALAGKEDALHG